MSTPAVYDDKPTAAMIKELETSFMAGLAQVAHDMLPGVALDIMASDDLELKRKFLGQAADLLGWKKAPPKDQNDSLPVFNFNFGSGGAVQMTATAPDGTTLQTLDFSPTAAMAGMSRINEDVAFDD